LKANTSARQESSAQLGGPGRGDDTIEEILGRSFEGLQHVLILRVTVQDLTMEALKKPHSW